MFQPRIKLSNGYYYNSNGCLDCEVEELRASTKQGCIFPFKFGQMSFNGCTPMLHPQDNALIFN